MPISLLWHLLLPFLSQWTEFLPKIIPCSHLGRWYWVKNDAPIGGEHPGRLTVEQVFEYMVHNAVQLSPLRLDGYFFDVRIPVFFGWLARSDVGPVFPLTTQYWLLLFRKLSTTFLTSPSSSLVFRRLLEDSPVECSWPSRDASLCACTNDPNHSRASVYSVQSSTRRWRST